MPNAAAPVTSSYGDKQMILRVQNLWALTALREKIVLREIGGRLLACPGALTR